MKTKLKKEFENGNLKKTSYFFLVAVQSFHDFAATFQTKTWPSLFDGCFLRPAFNGHNHSASSLDQ